MEELDSEANPKNKKRGPRVPKKITPERLHNVALHYLDRFAASSKGLRDVLMRRVYRAARHHDTDMAQAEAWVDDLIARFERSGLLNDKAFAEARARGLHAQGQSARMVRMKLAQKGLGGDEIDAALENLSDEHEDPEFEAALMLARKRRMGPYRDPEKRGEMREKDLAALARSGFSYDMALTIIDAETIDELEDRHRDGIPGLR